MQNGLWKADQYFKKGECIFFNITLLMTNRKVSNFSGEPVKIDLLLVIVNVSITFLNRLSSCMVMKQQKQTFKLVGHTIEYCPLNWPITACIISSFTLSLHALSILFFQKHN